MPRPMKDIHPPQGRGTLNPWLPNLALLTPLRSREGRLELTRRPQLIGGSKRDGRG